MISIYRNSKKVATISSERDGSFELRFLASPAHQRKRVEQRHFQNFETMSRYLDGFLGSRDWKH